MWTTFIFTTAKTILLKAANTRTSADTARATSGMSEPMHLAATADSPPQQQMRLAELNAHLNQQALQLAQNPNAEQMRQKRAARRRDGVLGETAARELMANIMNMPGGLAAFVAGNVAVQLPPAGNVAVQLSPAA